MAVKEALQPLEVEVKKVEAPKAKPNYKYLRDKDREMVKGIFRFIEVPGGVMEFSIKLWKEDPVEKYTLIDGETYTLPLGVARHINNNCSYPIHSYIKDKHGNPIQSATTRVNRCHFQSLEFTDIEELKPSLTIVRDL